MINLSKLSWSWRSRRQNIPQVYCYQKPLVTENCINLFKGRIDILREIKNLSVSDQTLLIYGGRKNGKTSLLNQIPTLLDKSDIIPLLIDVQGAASATTIKGFASNLAQQIIDSARRLPGPPRDRKS